MRTDAELIKLHQILRKEAFLALQEPIAGALQELVSPEKQASARPAIPPTLLRHFNTP